MMIWYMQMPTWGSQSDRVKSQRQLAAVPRRWPVKYISSEEKKVWASIALCLCLPPCVRLSLSHHKSFDPFGKNKNTCMFFVKEIVVISSFITVYSTWNKMTSGDNLNSSITEISQNIEKCPGDLRRLAINYTLVKNTLAILCVKNSQKRKIIIISRRWRIKRWKRIVKTIFTKRDLKNLDDLSY